MALSEGLYFEKCISGFGSIGSLKTSHRKGRWDFGSGHVGMSLEYGSERLYC